MKFSYSWHLQLRFQCHTNLVQITIPEIHYPVFLGTGAYLLPFFQLIQICEVFLGFLQTVSCCLPKADLQFLLCICFPTSLLSTASPGTGVGGQNWRQSTGAQLPHPPGPSAQGRYLILASVPSLHFGGHRISLIPWAFILCFLFRYSWCVYGFCCSYFRGQISFFLSPYFSMQ